MEYNIYERQLFGMNENKKIKWNEISTERDGSKKLSLEPMMNNRSIKNVELNENKDVINFELFTGERVQLQMYRVERILQRRLKHPHSTHEERAYLKYRSLKYFRIVNGKPTSKRTKGNPTYYSAISALQDSAMEIQEVINYEQLGKREHEFVVNSETGTYKCIIIIKEK